MCAARGDLAGDGVDQHRLEEARGQRFVAAHEDAVVVLAAERGAGKGDEADLHVRLARPRGGDRLVERAELPHRRQAAIGRDHLRHLVVLPILHHQVGPGVDHAGRGHDRGPGQGDDAEQVVQVEPLDPRRPCTPHVAETELAHEGGVEHHARDDRQEHQERHEAEEQLARLAGEHFDVQGVEVETSRRRRAWVRPAPPRCGHRPRPASGRWSRVGVSDRVTYQMRSSSGSCETNMPCLAGKRCRATCSTVSRLTRGASAGSGAASTSVPSQAPIW